MYVAGDGCSDTNTINFFHAILSFILFVRFLIIEEMHSSTSTKISLKFCLILKERTEVSCYSFVQKYFFFILYHINCSRYQQGNISQSIIFSIRLNKKTKTLVRVISSVKTLVRYEYTRHKKHSLFL